MFDFLLELFRTNSVAVLFAVLGIGYLIGRLGIRGFSLGPVAGVLLAGLAFGHFGFTMSGVAQTLGFTLFIADSIFKHIVHPPRARSAT